MTYLLFLHEKNQKYLKMYKTSEINASICNGDILFFILYFERILFFILYFQAYLFFNLVFSDPPLGTPYNFPKNLDPMI